MTGDKRKSGGYPGHNASPYQNEILAITATTEALKSANPSNTCHLIAAVSKNISLWGIFEFAARDPSNSLPIEIRLSVIKLAALTRYLSLVTVRIPSHLQDLIAINEAILDGLRRQANNSPGSDTPFSGKIDV